ncbi:MAG: carboxymuconolactone decarboxylase family protein [Chloroflexi bacterium]|nr:carboxymuconolactone decarboxylase family protein [Chloroflexota bacterium]
MNESSFNKRIFTLSTFAASARDLFAHLDDLHRTFTQWRISRPFAEKIMMAVTQVNGCRYCSYAHTRMALQAGVSEIELHNLLSGELNHLPEHEIIAVLFAQHYAEQADRDDAAAWQRLQDAYGADVAGDILTHIRVITFANLYGNTFDALLERFRFRPVSGSHFFDEVMVLSAGAIVVPLGLFSGMIVRRLNVAVFHRRDLRVHHD